MSTLELAREIRDELGIEYVRDVLSKMDDCLDDFTTDDDRWRFISEDAIDEVQQEELLNDLYILGCFNAGFLASICDIPLAAIEACQNAEAFEAVGELVKDHIEAIQKGYSSADGYGHHFSHYDHSEREIDGYFVFRIN